MLPGTKRHAHKTRRNVSDLSYRRIVETQGKKRLTRPPPAYGLLGGKNQTRTRKFRGAALNKRASKRANLSSRDEGSRKKTTAASRTSKDDVNKREIQSPGKRARRG